MHREKGEFMLNMSLNEIRGQIQINPQNWINLGTTNCYAYALGLDIRESRICKSAYQPGTISGVFDPTILREYFLYSDLIKNIEKDLSALDIFYREINFNDKIDLDEWKIALFAETYNNDLDVFVSDFHFIRANSKGVWTHKPGYFGSPSKKDYSSQIITDLEKCDLYLYEYKKCYALRLNKNSNL